MRVFVGAFAALLLLAGCSDLPGMGSKAVATPSVSAAPIGSPLAKASGQLDAEVPMPAGFPADLPIYPKARLTAGASFASTGQVAWGMEWETTDDSGKVQAYYARQLSQGDWTLTVNNQANGAAYAAVFARKSNSHDKGTLAINSDSGVTTIALSLLSSG
ncbi:MAG TPA: hypothetical protein VGX22_14920 [Candidatus Dormibacteraeota bacterium]|nr:hypothetical protein [Candidatus Dormibacteraeota bacterium]